MSFLKVRNAHKSENTEDYLELINDLINNNGEARIVEIANKLNVAQATANKTIKRLHSQGYVKKEPYRSVFLTLKGQKIASQSKKLLVFKNSKSCWKKVGHEIQIGKTK